MSIIEYIHVDTHSYIVYSLEFPLTIKDILLHVLKTQLVAPIITQIYSIK